MEAHLKCHCDTPSCYNWSFGYIDHISTRPYVSDDNAKVPNSIMPNHTHSHTHTQLWTCNLHNLWQIAQKRMALLGCILLLFFPLFLFIFLRFCRFGICLIWLPDRRGSYYMMNPFWGRGKKRKQLMWFVHNRTQNSGLLCLSADRDIWGKALHFTLWSHRVLFVAWIS